MKLDTVKIAMSVDAARPNLIRIEREGIHRESQDPSKPQSSVRVEPPGVFGLRSVTLDRLSAEVTIEASSKLFGPDFGRGVSDATVGQMAHVLTATGIVAPDEGALREARVLRADAFVDVPLAISRAMAALASLQSKAFPIKARYATSLALGSPAAQGLRLSLYDKGAELGAARSRSFREWIGGSVARRFVGLTRVELQASKFTGLRLMGAIGEPRLDDLLRSQKLPISEHLRRISEKAPAPTVAADPHRLLDEGLPLLKIERALGRDALLEHFAYNWGSVEAFVRGASGSNASRHLEEYRRRMSGHELDGDEGLREHRSEWVERLMARVEEEERRARPL